MQMFQHNGYVFRGNDTGWRRVSPSIRAERPPPWAQTSIEADIVKINGFVNNVITYVSDMDAWGKADRWQSVDETLSLRTGDCEDVAILKIAGLYNLGYRLENMSLVLLRIPFYGDHAVAVYDFGNGQKLVMDNQSDGVYFDTSKPNYKPYYAYGFERNWSFV